MQQEPNRWILSTLDDLVTIVNPQNVESLVADLSGWLRDIAKIKGEFGEGVIAHQELEWIDDGKSDTTTVMEVVAPTGEVLGTGTFFRPGPDNG